MAWLELLNYLTVDNAIFFLLIFNFSISFSDEPTEAPQTTMASPTTLQVTNGKYLSVCHAVLGSIQIIKRWKKYII